MDTKERNEKIELYGSGYELLRAALAEVPAEAMKFKPEPKEWSVYEIIIHIADSESNAASRARKLIAEPGGSLDGIRSGYMGSSWNYHEQSLEDALETTRLVRKTTYELVKEQPDKVFTHTVKHPEYASRIRLNNGSILHFHTLAQVPWVTASPRRLPPADSRDLHGCLS